VPESPFVVRTSMRRPRRPLLAHYEPATADATTSTSLIRPDGSGLRRLNDEDDCLEERSLGVQQEHLSCDAVSGRTS